MKHKEVRWILNFSFAILMLLSCCTFVLCIAGGGVLNDLYFALEEMENLESKKLLHSSPENISRITKREIKMAKTSATLQEDINMNHESVSKLETIGFILLVLSFFTLILRIHFRERRATTR